MRMNCERLPDPASAGGAWGEEILQAAERTPARA